MARFRATIKGTRGEASRLGHREITAHVHGWNTGIAVDAKDAGGEDCFVVTITGGSNGPRGEELLRITNIDNGEEVKIEVKDRGLWREV